MKIEELLFAMSDDSNDFLLLGLDEKKNNDDGFNEPNPCRSRKHQHLAMRRSISTPNLQLLQIPNPCRSRKKSDDSAVGSVCSSAEESEGDKLSDNFIGNELYNANMCNRDKQEQDSPLSPDTTDEELTNTTTSSGSTSSGCRPPFKFFRPPSVVVSQCDQYPEMTLDDLDAEFNEKNRNNSYSRRVSNASSTCSSFSFSDSDLNLNTLSIDDECPQFEEPKKSTGGWKKLQRVVHGVTPFIQTYKKYSYPWVQLAGHQGNFKPGDKIGTILKKFCLREKESFELLMQDELKQFVPIYYGVVNDSDGNEYIQLEDLLGQFHKPSVMDCKIGVRTYLEEELMKAKEKPKLRKDMYEKMLQIDPDAPTDEEKHLKGVTKPRYMVWRETISTTATYGFRIEGIRRNDGTSSRDFKTIRNDEQVSKVFQSFIEGSESDLISQYTERLLSLKTAFAKSQFFASHEVIGSSLLFVHDSMKAGIWMIDFAKSCPLPEGAPKITHESPWSLGNHEDGYLIGLNHLIKIFEKLK